MTGLRRYLVLFFSFSFHYNTNGFSVERESYLEGETTFHRNNSQNLQNQTGGSCFAVDVDTSSMFSGLNFNASWIKQKYFWQSEDFQFEKRFEAHMSKVFRDQKDIRVFVVPHSHNDPGWLNTYDQYYYIQTRHILDNVVSKLMSMPEMTFVWNEITYLSKWWKEVSPTTRTQFKTLVDEGRLEIVTGGWVMPDEATTSLFALIHELTEGQQWLKNNLDVKPKYAWGIDPFGHSSTVSHLLKNADAEGMVIQRLHYVWKHWLAEHKSENFLWKPRWDTTGAFEIPCLSLPFDLYSIKHSCGPDPQVCLKFDFRSIQYEYGENFGLMTPITKSNIQKLSPEIVAQYQRTASLTNHNIILVPLGDDFRYDRSIEWEQQYSNYMQLFSFVNKNKDKFRMEIKFGTLRDYFEAINHMNKRSERRPTLSGDFFPYGDVYASGKPSYWTGFYGSRPYWKKLYREVENELRSAEILFTFANSLANQSDSNVNIPSRNSQYLDLVHARHDFAIFAHHDGVTGTSKRWTMLDYGIRLYEAYNRSINVQLQSIQRIYETIADHPLQWMSKDFLRERFDKLPVKLPLEVFKGDEYVTKIMLFNSLGWRRTELIKIHVKRPSVIVTNSEGMRVTSQINPVLVFDGHYNGSGSTVHISERMFELVFLADLQPLSLSVFHIFETSETNENAKSFARVHCSKCSGTNASVFTIDMAQQDSLTMENEHTKLYFQRNGLLKKAEKRAENMTISQNVNLSFGSYNPTDKESGAYLLKPILTSEIRETPSLQVVKITGPVMSQVISVHSSRYEVIRVNTTLLMGNSSSSSPEASEFMQGILLETYVDFTRDYSNKVEAFMRFDTDLKSTEFVQKSDQEEEEVPVLYTDQNGLASEKRVTIPSIGYEGNMYPVTTMTHIQDTEGAGVRLSILVDRTHGFCSMKRGRLETLIERKSFYDDGRGMSEGVADSKPTTSSYIILLESLKTDTNVDENDFVYWQPTLSSYKSSLRLNYPPNVFVFNEALNERQDIPLLSSPLPDNAHLLNLRTISRQQNISTARADESPDKVALMNIQYLPKFDGFHGKCGDRLNLSEEQVSQRMSSAFKLRNLNLTKVSLTSLTGVVSNGTQSHKFDGNSTKAKPLLVNFKLFFS